MNAVFSSFGGRLAGLRKFVFAHKILSGIVIIAMLGGGYWAYGKLHPATTETRYILGTVATGTIIASVSESGQVAATDSIDIKPEVSGTITWVGVKAGDKVTTGQALMTIDDTTALQTLNDAKKSLAASQLQFQKDTAQAPISYQTDLNALQTAKENLATDYNDAYNDLTSTYLDLPALMSASHDTIYGYDFDSRKLQNNADALMGYFTTQDTSAAKAFRTSAERDYNAALDSYNASLAAYQGTSRTSTTTVIEDLLAKTTDTMTGAAQTLQTELNFFSTVSDLATTYDLRLPANFSTVQTATRSALSTANSDLSTLLTAKKTIDSAKQAITNAQNAITLDEVGNPNGDNPISLQISKNSIEKSQQDIANQEADLAKYTIRAPFNGTISAVDVKIGDSVGSGAVATIISSAQVATVSVNEVDAAKIKIGDKVTMTLDAIDGLTLTGTVAEIDPAGTVSQGVVSYDVKIAFDQQDPRVKSGMTVNADIETDIAIGTLIVPSNAVKTQGGQSYVQVFEPAISAADVAAAGSAGVLPSTAPISIPVTTGISDNANVQILSGLSSGQQIVVSSRSGSGQTSSAAATSLTGGARGFGGGAIRIGG